MADLQNDEDNAHRNIKLCCEDVQGYNVLTNFHGMQLTRDKLCSLIKKWQTLIEANVDVRTTDGTYLSVSLSGLLSSVHSHTPPLLPWPSGPAPAACVCERAKGPEPEDRNNQAV